MEGGDITAAGAAVVVEAAESYATTRIQALLKELEDACTAALDKAEDLPALDQNVSVARDAMAAAFERATADASALTSGCFAGSIEFFSDVFPQRCALELERRSEQTRDRKEYRSK